MLWSTHYDYYEKTVKQIAPNDSHGVYVIWDFAEDKVIYVGKAEEASLRGRLLAHVPQPPSGKGDNDCIDGKFKRSVVMTFQFLELADDISGAERYLHDELKKIGQAECNTQVPDAEAKEVPMPPSPPERAKTQG